MVCSLASRHEHSNLQSFHIVKSKSLNKMSSTISSKEQIPSLSEAPQEGPCAQDTKNTEVDDPQAQHRVNLLNFWGINAGNLVLEIGCGQGLCTCVLAKAVGPNGHIDAVDPAPLDYGTPWTLGQAQKEISESEIGDRISWHQADPETFIQENSTEWDVAVLAHSIWYFEEPNTLTAMLKALKGKVKKLCISEYALQASEWAAVPHLLTALGRGFLESKRSSLENIRTPLSPNAIKQRAQDVGWVLQKESIMVPHEDLMDGMWEVNMFGNDCVVEEVEALQANEKVKQMILSARDAVLASLRILGNTKLRTMDVWVSVFVWGNAS